MSLGLNFKDFSSKEKLLLIVVSIGLAVFLGAFIHRYFILDLNDPKDLQQELARINYDFAIYFVLMWSGISAYIGAHSLTNSGANSTGKSEFGEFEKTKLHEANQVTFMTGLTFVMIILALLFANKNFSEHLYYSNLRFGEEYFLKAIKNIEQREYYLEQAAKFTRTSAKLDFMKGIIFTVFSINLARIPASIFVWLKYR